MNPDHANAAFRPLTGADTVGYLDFSSAATEQTITLVAGAKYQIFMVGSGEVLVRLDGSTATFPATTALVTGIVVAPGQSPVVTAAGATKAAARAAGCKIYFQRVVPE